MYQIYTLREIDPMNQIGPNYQIGRIRNRYLQKYLVSGTYLWWQKILEYHRISGIRSLDTRHYPPLRDSIRLLHICHE